MQSRTLCSLICCAAVLVTTTASSAEFESQWPENLERVWIGPEYWSNPLQDWRVAHGRLECISRAGNRNVHVLTHQLGERRGDLTMSVRLGAIDGSVLNSGQGSAGFRIGIIGPLRDYRNSLIKGTGLDAGIRTAGQLFIGQLKQQIQEPVDLAHRSVELRLVAEPVNESYRVTLSALDGESGKLLGKVSRDRIAPDQLVGNLALVSNYQAAARGANKTQFWFSNWNIRGSKVEAHQDHLFGPILFAMHTLSRGVLKLTAQLPPIGASESQTVLLQTRGAQASEWATLDEASIDPLSRTATFRIEGWDSSRDTPYRLVYTMTAADGSQEDKEYTGVVRRDPIEREELVVAGFTGHQDYLFPNTVLAENVAKVDPDVLVFTGDQIYEGNAGYGIVREPVETAALDYLRKWYVWGWGFRDLMRDRVTICLPDDHDVYQGNIWGQNGRSVASMREHSQGGYAMHADWVNTIQRTQASHLPDPFDPTPVEQGITVYYGSMLYGGVGFAIIEDRKFKSGPEGKVNDWQGRPDHVTDPNYDPKSVDKPGLKLLGDRQLEFLREFATDWRGHEMKLACSQTIFANVANYHGGNQMYLVADLDSNGWPQTGRNKALHELRRGFVFQLAGDQHLASIVHHGIDEWRDAGISFCVPSTAAGYPRSWHPEREGKAGQNRPAGSPPELGDFLDGLGNRITVWAVGNPEPREKQRRDPLGLGHDKASGFGVVTLNKNDRTYKLDCWRLISDPSDPKPQDQFPGWPRVIQQTDNFGREAVAYLPEIRVHGLEDPVIQVFDESRDEIVYTLRIKGTTFRPKVFAEGTYRVRVGEQDPSEAKVLRGLRAFPPDEMKSLDVHF